MEAWKRSVSVVIPHGGEAKLPHLKVCLANLRQLTDVAEIIVVEMGNSPFGEAVARRWADKYVYVSHSGQFERGRALNIGSAFAESEFILWLDNDLLVPADFVSRAIEEMRARRLDFLKPYFEVRYLSIGDSEKVMQGVCAPEECRPANVYSSATTDGGAGLVRNDFLRRYGGIPAGFRGWGGEDNGWMFKVGLLGRSSRTQLRQQRLYHLYHPLSGGYGGSAHMAANPHYRENLALLDRMRRIRTPQAWLDAFPPAPVQLWENSRRVRLVTGENAREAETAENLARELRNLFSARVEIASTSKEKKSPASRSTAEDSPDAIVFFDKQTAREFIAADSNIAAKVLILAGEDFAFSKEDSGWLHQCFGVLATSETLFEQLEAKKMKSWLWKKGDGTTNFRSLALALAQSLSLVINSLKTSNEMQATESGLTTNLPVWLYWEGDCPDWIEACRKTILASAPNARFLTPETFNELWDRDRDINLANLHVAHRADFIRAFLLYRFGGLWIDADCVMLKSVEPMLERLGERDFMAHRERGGFFGNEFILARPGSRIAKAFYERICRTLRARKPFGWCEIGCVALTETINAADAPFGEIDCELIQPLCWRETEPYFEEGDEARHSGVFNENAICYMLSHLEINKYLASNPGKNLLAKNTFFSYLLKRAMSNGHESLANKSANGNHRRQAANWKEIPFYLEKAALVAPEKVLDLDFGLGRWGLLLRDFFEPQREKQHWQMRIEAITDSANEIKAAHSFFYDRVETGNAESLLEQNGQKWNLTILGDSFSQATSSRGEILQKALRQSDYVLMSINQWQNENGASSQPIFDYLETLPARIISSESETNRAMVLLSASDPKKLRKNGDRERIFTDYAAACRRAGESASGPGSSLAQTAEIRRRLPLLFASLDIKSMLDAPCGDFNWLRHLDLRLEKYIGVDLVPAIIEQNQKQFGSRKRKFMALDITTDFLPRCDLIFCRDCLVHLPDEDIFAALRRFRASCAKYLLTTTFPNRKANPNIKTGDWRPLNLQLPPFNFPAPVRLINEHCTEGNGQYIDKSLGLWLLSDLC